MDLSDINEEENEENDSEDELDNEWGLQNLSYNQKGEVLRLTKS